MEPGGDVNRGGVVETATVAVAKASVLSGIKKARYAKSRTCFWA